MISPALLGAVGGGGSSMPPMNFRADSTSGARSTSDLSNAANTSSNSGAGNRGFINDVAFPGAKKASSNDPSGGGVGGGSSSAWLPWILGGGLVVAALWVILNRR
jgi:hypothetical protein